MTASKKNTGGLQVPEGSGESQGGARPGTPPARRSPGKGSFHGGQSVQGYHGPSNPNATTKAD